MNFNFVIILIIILVLFYFWKSINYEKFRLSPLYSNNYYYMNHPQISDIDYQAYLNTTSGYDSATRTYDNPLFAQQVADGLDT